MKKEFSVVLFVLCFSIVACNQNSSVPEQKNNYLNLPPPVVYFDLDGDSVSDFKTEFNTIATTDEPPSECSNIITIRPLDSNRILYNSSSGYLFLSRYDTIFALDKSYNYWFHYGADIMYKPCTDSVWRIINQGNTKEFYLGVSLLKYHRFIGWMKLLLDSTGKVKLESSSLTEKNYIIISE